MASTSSYPRSPYTTLFRSTSAGADTTYKAIVAGARSNMDVIKAARVSQLVQYGKIDEILAQASTLGDLVLTDRKSTRMNSSHHVRSSADVSTKKKNTYQCT